MQVNKRRQQSLAFRWIINACRDAGGRPMSDRLADELMAASRKEGKAMNTREQTHRMADANKASPLCMVEQHGHPACPTINKQRKSPSR